jgi:hypothetical protein
MKSVRIQCDGLSTNGAKITTEDGVDITNLITSVRLDMVPGEPNRVTLGAYVDKLDVLAKVVDVVEEYPQPPAED